MFFGARKGVALLEMELQAGVSNPRRVLRMELKSTGGAVRKGFQLLSHHSNP